MAAPTSVLAMVGFRNLRIYALTTAGVPAATSSTVYEGTRVSGASTLTVTHPQPRDIIHFGDDIVFARDILPPNAAVDAVLKAGKIRNDLDALVSGVKSYTVGEAKGLNVATDQQGFEPQFGILSYSQAVDADESGTTMGTRMWGSVIFPKAWVIFQEQPRDQNPYSSQYTVRSALVNSHLWGIAYTTGTEGSLIAQLERWATLYKPIVVSWKVSGTSPSALLFASARQAVSTSKIHVITQCVGGTGAVTDVTSGTTKATTGITPASQGDGDIFTCFYEYA